MNWPISYKHYASPNGLAAAFDGAPVDVGFDVLVLMAGVAFLTAGAGLEAGLIDFI